MKSFLYKVVVFVILSVPTPQAGGIVGYNCSGLFQMDADGSAFIEGGRPFPRDEYQAVKFRSCNANPFALQLWQCSAAMDRCTLKWQTVVSGSGGRKSNDSVIVDLGTSIRVDPSYRLGLYAPITSDSRLPVPFGVGSSLAFLLESVERFSSFDDLRPEKTIALRPTSWTRSFAKSLVFCRNKDCTDQPPNSLAPVDVVTDPAGQGQCCEQNFACNTRTNQQSAANEEEINQLKNLVDILEQQVNKLNSGDTPLSRCPLGFVPGEYGLVSCYRIFRESVSISEAIVACRETSAGSKLLQIESQAEQRFLARFTVSSGANARQESFWLGAKYVDDEEKQNWFWMDARQDDQQRQQPISYTDWKDGLVPKSTDAAESCSALVVKPKISYWNMTRCSDNHYFICEVPKECD